MVKADIFWVKEKNKIVENQDLYRNEDDFGKNLKTKNLYFLTRKILKFISTSAKCIFWLIWNEIVKTQDLYMNKGDFWKKYIYFFRIIFLFFYKDICEMYILADIE